MRPEGSGEERPVALAPDERARVQRAVDRVEERTVAAEHGLHLPGAPADPAALAASGLPEGAAMVWQLWDGYELSSGESRLLPLAQIDAATEAAQAEEILAAGDRVIGEAGRDTLVLPADPWAEGADVVRVLEDGERLPEASSVAHLLLGLLAESGVIYDAQGEFREDVIGEDAVLTPQTLRRLLRRRLDHDQDAPRSRLELARALRRAGELQAAKRELTAVLKRAPQWCWVHHELGAVLASLGDARGAQRSQEKAAEDASDDALRAYFLAWAATSAAEKTRVGLAAKVLALRPEFAAEQLRAAEALVADENLVAAQQTVALGLAVAPMSLPLLALRREL